MLTRVCLTLPLLFGALQENPAGSAFVSKEGGFSVVFPQGQPQESKQRVATSTGHLDVTLFQAEDKQGVAYVVSYSDLPAADYKKGTEDMRLDYAREGAVTSARGTLRGEKRIKLDGSPGRELLINGEEGMTVRVRLYVVERRLYQLLVLGPAEATNSARATAFLDSFRLAK